MEDNPYLHNFYEQQAERTGPLEGRKAMGGVREGAASLPAFDETRLAKIKTIDDGHSFSDEETFALRKITSELSEKRLAGPLSAEDQGKFDLYSKAAKLAGAARGQSLSLLNQSPIQEFVSTGQYKKAALAALDEISPTGKASDKAIQAVREMADNPLEMARTVFRQSRRNHGFLQNFITANLLSNVFGTAPLNMFSNIVNVAAQTAKRKPSEWGTAIAGLDRGVRDAGTRAGFAAKEGFTMEALTNPKLAAEAPGFAALGLKNPFNWGGRAAFSGDEFIKGMAEQSHIDVLAKARALEVAGADKARAKEIADNLSNNPTPEMLKEAKEFAKNVSYQMEPDEATGMLSRFINWAPVGKGTRAEIKPVKIAVPFFNTVMNVAKANVAISPVGAVAGAIQGARGKITPGQAVTQIAMGLIPTAIGLALAERGIITGPIPKDAAEREASFESGRTPWSIQIGNKKLPLAWAGPFALSLGLGAALKDAKRKSEIGKIDQDLATIGYETAGNAFRLFMEGSPLISLSSLLDAIADPSESKIKKLATNVGSSMTPLVSLQGFLNRQDMFPGLRDAFVRDTSGQTALEEVLNGIAARTVAGRKLLQKRLTSLGAEIDRPGQLTQSAPDPVFSELYRLGVYPGMPSRSVAGLPGQRDMKLTPEEYRETLKAGEPAYDMLRQQLATPTWNAQPDDQKRLIVQTIFGGRALDKLRKAKRAEIRGRKLAGSAN
jgi:hypothetical protein